jgi:hypothetical protein
MFDDKEFSDHFKATRRMVFMWSMVWGGVSLAMIGFLFWLIIKLMAHFGVI